MASGTVGVPDSIITVHPYERMGWATENTYPCTCGQKAGKPPSLIGSSIPTIDPFFPVDCTQPPPGVTVEVIVPTDSANAFICTEPTNLPGSDFKVNVARSGSSSSLNPMNNFQIGGSSISKQALTSGVGGVFGLLLLLAVGSTIYYRQRYLQLLNGTQATSKANKSKRQ